MRVSAPSGSCQAGGCDAISFAWNGPIIAQHVASCEPTRLSRAKNHAKISPEFSQEMRSVTHTMKDVKWVFATKSPPKLWQSFGRHSATHCATPTAWRTQVGID